MAHEHRLFGLFDYYYFRAYFLLVLSVSVAFHVILLDTSRV